MTSRPVDAIFQITRVTIVTSGEPTSDIAVHAATRGDQNQMLAVTIGDLLVYCYDHAAVAGFADAWRDATQTTPFDLPEQIDEPAANPHDVAIVVRVDGEPQFKVNGLGAATNPTGRPHVRVVIGQLLILAFDHASIQAWHQTWQQALALAAPLWPSDSRNTDPQIRKYRRRVLAAWQPQHDGA